MNKKQRILEIIETLALPISPEEAKATVENLSEHEIDLLMPLYEELIVLHNVIDDEAAKADPTRYEKLQRDYREKLADIAFAAEEDKIEADYQYQKELSESEEELKVKRDEAVKELEEEIGKISNLPN